MVSYFWRMILGQVKRGIAWARLSCLRIRSVYAAYANSGIKKFHNIYKKLQNITKIVKSYFTLSLLLFFSFISFAEEIDYNSLYVASELLKDSFIFDNDLLPGEMRVYYSSLKTTQPPSYTIWRGVSPITVSQVRLWDILTINDGGHYISVYNDNDGMGSYIKVSDVYNYLENLDEPFAFRTNSVTYVGFPWVASESIQVASRLLGVATAKSAQEVNSLSNACCNCDWNIVTNIYESVVNIATNQVETLDFLRDIYTDVHSLSNLCSVALYSNYQGIRYSVTDWVKFIWTYISTNNSGKPIKELLNDISLHTSATSDVVTNIWDWLQTNGGNLTNSVDYASITNNIFRVAQYINGGNVVGVAQELYAFQDYQDLVYDQFPLTLWSDYITAYGGHQNFANEVAVFSVFDNLLNYWSAKNTFYGKSFLSNITTNTEPIKTSWDSLTNKTTSVAYTLVEPSQGRDIYGTLTNAYITSGSMNSSSWTWFDRVEMLLAALVFQEANTNSNDSVFELDTNTTADNVVGAVDNFTTSVGSFSGVVGNYKDSALGVLGAIDNFIGNPQNQGIEWLLTEDDNSYFAIDTSNPIFGFFRTISVICWSCGFLYMIVRVISFLAPIFWKGFRLSFNIVSALIMR